ncbi:hypothetical protein ANANG_G00255250 [Anguilla anguilla]|uniref:Uncharacterized protein n=1 Tax=Anguilla anguilla TaxID=7936 RepID=A0A9D3LT08_ANGAN|nr:hypothetical protein ANANG_G00255250 [Anguilla anguilla]
MKCLKVEDYVRRTACPDETRILCRELESFVKNGLGAAGRTVCDRVIRACNERLGAASLSAEHLDCLMGLVELALRGYDSSTLSAPQCDPLYMEKILFHVLKKVATRGSQAWCQFLGDLLYDRLALAALTADRLLLAQSCFAVLWNEPAGPGGGGGGGGGGPQPSPDRWIANQLKTLRFLLLQQRDPQAPSKVAKHAEDALTKYAKARGVLREGDARHLLEQRAPGAGRRLDAGSPCLAVALDLARRAAEIHRAPAGSAGGADRVRPRPPGPAAEPGHQERHAVLHGCQLVAWVLEVGQYGPLGGSTLLAWFSFLEGYQELLEKHIQMGRWQMEQKHYHTLCCILQQSLVDAYESLEASQLEEAESLERVLLYCQSAASRLVDALRKLANDSTFAKAVSAINSVVRGLHNRKLYEQAFSLAEILCQELRKDRHPSLPVEKLNRTFMLAVLCSRRAGRLEQALDWVGHWLRALGGRVLDHMAEPVSLWAKIKADAARAGQEDMRLRTLRDGLGQDPGRGRR